jgi:hypothetical protein
MAASSNECPAHRRRKPQGQPKLPRARYRSLRGRLGGPKAIKAMARYLACLIYRMLMKGQDWVDRGAAYYEQRRQQRELIHLEQKAKALGLQLVPSNTRDQSHKIEAQPKITGKFPERNEYLAAENRISPHGLTG